MNNHKAVMIPDGICQTNIKLFVNDNPRNGCKLEFTDNL